MTTTPPPLTSRKLLQTSALNNISPSTTVTPPPPNTTTGAPFDSSTTITIIALLTALFFMAFFSFYIRQRFTAHSSPPPPPPPPVPLHSETQNRGLDASAIKSLPLIAYGGAEKHGMIVTEDECPICLQEFEVGECLKMIPYCGHLFHPTCLDTWLGSHVTCPFCRSGQLFKDKEVRVDVGGDGDTWSGVGTNLR